MLCIIVSSATHIYSSFTFTFNNYRDVLQVLQYTSETFLTNHNNENNLKLGLDLLGQGFCLVVIEK